MIIDIEGSTNEAARKLRQNLHTLRSAMDHLEDSPEFEEAHLALDSAGRLGRTRFMEGCHLDYEDGTYYQSCPVALAHSRVGLSPGYIVREAECSICGEDPELCEHVAGHVYDGTLCVRVVKEADLLEVSLVARPSQPDARITRMSVSRVDIQAKLGPRFATGMPVLCDRCLADCNGVSDNFADVRRLNPPS